MERIGHIVAEKVGGVAGAGRLQAEAGIATLRKAIVGDPHKLRTKVGGQREPTQVDAPAHLAERRDVITGQRRRHRVA